MQRFVCIIRKITEFVVNVGVDHVASLDYIKRWAASEGLTTFSEND